MPAITRSQSAKLAQAIITPATTPSSPRAPSSDSTPTRVTNKLTHAQLTQRFGQACFNGDLQLVQAYCQKYFILPSILNVGFISACRKGKLLVAQWIHEHNKYTIGIAGVYGLGYAIKGGHLELVLWLHPLLVQQGLQQVLHKSYPKIFHDTCYYGQFNTAKWLYEQDHSLANTYTKITKIYNQLPTHWTVAVWLHQLRQQL